MGSFGSGRGSPDYGYLGIYDIILAQLAGLSLASIFAALGFLAEVTSQDLIMDYILKFGELVKYFEKADFTDVKIFEGETTLRRFIASMLSYYPWWIVLLYRVRKLLVGILGLVKHQAPEELPNLHPEDVSFNPGDNVTFFKVRCTKEESYWISETPDDKHLRAYFGVVREPVDSSMNRFYVITTVFYKHWTGPIYFNLIRPFHHLVVSQMAKYGLRH